MNILITGSNGYVGNALASALNHDNHLLLIKNSDIYRRESNTFYLNLSDQSHIDTFCQENLRIDAIIHTASKMASIDMIDDISILYDNLKMYDNLAILAHRFQPKKLINFSSMAVYPNADGEYDESSVINPAQNNDAFYGLSKFCGENIIDFRLRKSTTKITHLRVGQIYSDSMRDDRLYMMMKKELKENNQITVYGNGERTSSFIHLTTLIDVTKFFINLDSENMSGIFNVGENNFSYKEFAELIVAKFGDDASQIILHTAGSKMKFLLNSDKLKRFMDQNV